MKKCIKTLLVLCVLCAGTAASAKTYVLADKLFIDGEVRAGQLVNTRVPDRFDGAAGDMASYGETFTRLDFGAGYDVTEDITINARGMFYTLYGKRGPEDVLVDSQTDKAQLAEGNIEFRNLFGFVDAKIGRQFYQVFENWYGPNYSNYERLIYTALDGVVLTFKPADFTVDFIAGKEADLADWSDTHYVASGVHMRGLNYKNLYFDAMLYDKYYYDDHDDHFGFYGVKPYFKTDKAAVSFEYLRAYGEDFLSDKEHSQFFMAEAEYEFDNGSFKLTPHASAAWHTGKDWAGGTIDYLPGIITGHIYGPSAVNRNLIINAGLRAQFYSLPKASFAFDVFNYTGRDSQTPDKGTEVDLIVKYKLCPRWEIGAGGAYLFAKEEFQSKDASKLQFFTVYKF